MKAFEISCYVVFGTIGAMSVLVQLISVARGLWWLRKQRRQRCVDQER